ncbi:jg21151 [Pararge aegeria aegeria]|uniref:Jg21151 protein n=1 Tax=Pararge aegeria aegeria TaxID=348720 RepID=A0A8S4SI18_9NEOP|nr:jg21151 [Pararge aegeria aegeria]
MWGVESTVVVPIVVSVNGLLAKSFNQHLKKLSLGCLTKGRIQKSVILETARIVRRLTLESSGCLGTQRPHRPQGTRQRLENSEENGCWRLFFLYNLSRK